MSHHLPDATKMISDTPLSDSTAHNIAELGMLCRRLERELNRLNDRIKRMEAITNDPHALWANWLRGDVKLPEGIGDVRQYQDRIKWLKEAGDALYEAWLGYGFTKDKHLAAWRKAKEAKL